MARFKLGGSTGLLLLGGGPGYLLLGEGMDLPDPPGRSKPVFFTDRVDRAFCEGQWAYLKGQVRDAPMDYYPRTAEIWLQGYDAAVAGVFAAFCNFRAP